MRVNVLKYSILFLKNALSLSMQGIFYPITIMSSISNISSTNAMNRIVPLKLLSTKLQNFLCARANHPEGTLTMNAILLESSLSSNMPHTPNQGLLANLQAEYGAISLATALATLNISRHTLHNHPIATLEKECLEALSMQIQHLCDFASLSKTEVIKLRTFLTCLGVQLETQKTLTNSITAIFSLVDNTPALSNLLSTISFTHLNTLLSLLHHMSTTQLIDALAPEWLHSTEPQPLSKNIRELLTHARQKKREELNATLQRSGSQLSLDSVEEPYEKHPPRPTPIIFAIATEAKLLMQKLKIPNTGIQGYFAKQDFRFRALTNAYRQYGPLVLTQAFLDLNIPIATFSISKIKQYHLLKLEQACLAAQATLRLQAHKQMLIELASAVKKIRISQLTSKHPPIKTSAARASRTLWALVSSLKIPSSMISEILWTAQEVLQTPAICEQLNSLKHLSNMHTLCLAYALLHYFPNVGITDHLTTSSLPPISLEEQQEIIESLSLSGLFELPSHQACINETEEIAETVV